jgi:hypothetical protein
VDRGDGGLGRLRIHPEEIADGMRRPRTAGNAAEGIPRPAGDGFGKIGAPGITANPAVKVRQRAAYAVDPLIKGASDKTGNGAEGCAGSGHGACSDDYGKKGAHRSPA